MIDLLGDLQRAAFPRREVSSASATGGASTAFLKDASTPRVCRALTHVELLQMPKKDAKFDQQHLALQHFIAETHNLRNGPLQDFQKAVKASQAKYKEVIVTVNATREKALLVEVDAITAKASYQASNVASNLKRLETLAGKFATSDEGSLKKQVIQGVFSSFKNLLHDHYQAHQAFRKEMDEKVQRQLRQIFPQEDDKTIADLAASGGTAIKDLMKEARGVAVQNAGVALQAQAERVDELEKMAASIAILAQCMQEIQVMVTAQGEQINSIAGYVEVTAEQTQQAAAQLVQAHDHHIQMRRRCCLMSIIAFLVTVFILVIWGVLS